MADQAARQRRKKADKAVDTESFENSELVNDIAEGIVDHFMDGVKPPALESIDQQRQRRKLQVVEELDDFRASFTRGYAVILSELARNAQVSEEKSE